MKIKRSPLSTNESNGVTLVICFYTIICIPYILKILIFKYIILDVIRKRCILLGLHYEVLTIIVLSYTITFTWICVTVWTFSQLMLFSAQYMKEKDSTSIMIMCTICTYLMRLANSRNKKKIGLRGTLYYILKL